MSVLQDMIDVAPDLEEGLDSSLGQIQEQIDELTIEINGIQNELCDVAETEILAYLNGTKIPELEIVYGDLELVTGPTFGTIGYDTGNISDWTVIDTTTGLDVYEYLGVNWDGDPIITKLITDYAFGNDYLTRPVTSGATYGLIPSRSNLYTAKSILTNNKNKIHNSITTFADYA
jgi:hypothetical protein